MLGDCQVDLNLLLQAFNSYSASVISPVANQGGIVSQITPAVTSSYYDSSITTQSDSDTRGLPRQQTN